MTLNNVQGLPAHSAGRLRRGCLLMSFRVVLFLLLLSIGGVSASFDSLRRAQYRSFDHTTSHKFRLFGTGGSARRSRSNVQEQCNCSGGKLGLHLQSQQWAFVWNLDNTVVADFRNSVIEVSELSESQTENSGFRSDHEVV